MDTWKNIKDRESGKLRPNSFANRIKSNRISQLELSNHKELVSPHKGSINSLQIDLTEGRYLLSAASDASVAVYDVHRPSDFNGDGLITKHNCLFFVDKQHQLAHKYAVSSAIWYPIDTGLFITGSYDHHVNVWDTNTTQVVVNFKMPGKVYKTAMSTLSTSHTLIAAGTEDVQVRLCDIASGAFAHTLSGHRDGVMTVEWSASSEWVLITGGCDGAIRFWDIRRAGCFQVLNQSQTQLGRRPPLLKRSVLTKESNTKMRPVQKKVANGSGSGHLPIGRLSSKGPMKQKLHPGMISTQDRATAHYGAVTGLKVTEDGMYLLSADDVVLVGESREEVNGRLETWRQALEAYGFRLSRSKTECMECNFSRRRSRSTLEVKVGDHFIPQVTRFKYLGSFVQNDGEIEADVSHHIQAGWLKWRRASGVLCDKKVPLKLKGKFYRTAV
ncbi:WD repeat-containing protein ATCSA-1 isoform X1 [Medicago truncatula]|uniref:WD repeat-containing protein ATCSA-1 isoform X1 n=1 Tax=Medicago truncatula TaxID=3880 RepID=UPI000D2F24C9|nr:WD repeat-containing protein ATCSA-1 isoform X1 [Medicago truncatula]